MQPRIPLDRLRVLQLDCGTGADAALIAQEHPWMRVTGCGSCADSIALACERHASDRLDFVVAHPPDLPFEDGAFDCACAIGVLERSADVEAVLAQLRRVLTDNGVLVAAIRPDAYQPHRARDSHTWKTSAEDVRERLRHVGFVDVGVQEIDTYRQGAAPYAPSADCMLHIQAWRRLTPRTPIERVDALRRWSARCAASDCARGAGVGGKRRRARSDPRARTLLLGEALARERFELRRAKMVAYEHPRGRGARLCETHEVIELTLPDRSVHVLDPIADVRFPHSLHTLIEHPTLADAAVREQQPTSCSSEQDSEELRNLYATSLWYTRVVAVAMGGGGLGAPRHFVPARWADRAGEPVYQAVAFMRGAAWRMIRQAVELRARRRRRSPPAH